MAALDIDLQSNRYENWFFHKNNTVLTVSNITGMQYWGNKELGWVILNNALATLVHYSESSTFVPLQIPIGPNAQLTILYRHSNMTV